MAAGTTASRKDLSAVDPTYAFTKALNLDLPSFDVLYATDQRLRSGAFATVYTCHPILRPDETFAVKILDRTKLKPRDDDAVFREVELLKELQDISP